MVGEEYEEYFGLDSLKYDVNKELDIAFGEYYDTNQNKREYTTPKYIASDIRLKTLARIILDEAVANKSTDIQILNLNSKVGVVRLRVGEEMIPYRKVHGTAIYGLSIIFKSMSQVNIEETRIGQGGRFTHEYNGEFFNIRSSFMPTIYGETISLRVLYSEQLSSDVSSLGLPDIVESTLRQVLSLREGLILLTGGTGSGKTTTMYTSIGHIQDQNSYTKNVITIENPVEYVIPGASQSQVSEVANYTFADGLKTALRQNPDIILIGEINDAETAGTAIRAATSGHLVFSTFHSNTTLTVPIGMEHFGIKKYTLNNSLTLVLNQTLANKLCVHCRKPIPVSVADRNWINKLGMDVPLLQVYTAVGCEHCSDFGYHGRVLCVSMLDVNKTYRKISEEEDKSLIDIEHELLTTEGANYYPMEKDVYRHLASGAIDLRTAMNILR